MREIPLPRRIRDYDDHSRAFWNQKKTNDAHTRALRQLDNGDWVVHLEVV